MFSLTTEMKKLFIIAVFGIFTVLTTKAQTGANCLDALPFCTGTNYVFPNSTSVPSLGNVACLGSTPNPIWYYMQVETPGNIDITMVQTSGGGGGLDVDFAVWGPFPNLAAGCGSPFPPGTPVDCSYSTAFTETANIPNAPAGQFYVLLITNYSNQAGTITFSQSGGVGTTDCGLLSNADNNGPLCEGQTLILNADVQQSSGSSFAWYQMPDFANSIGNTQTISITPTTLANNGDYAVIVTDIATLESDTSFTTVVVNPIPVAPSFDITSPACQGQTVTMTPNPALPAGTVYSWTSSTGYTNNTPTVTLNNAQTFFNGTYTLQVSVNGCQSPPYSQTLVVNPTTVPIISGPSEVCEGAFVSLSVNNATFNTFTWNGILGNNPQLLGPGTHTVQVEDANGCVTVSAPFEVTIIPNPLEITGDLQFCEGTPTTLSATPGKASYQWSTGSTSETTLVVADGIVTVTVTNAENCLRSDTVFVNMYDKPVAAYSPFEICDGTPVSFTNLSQVQDVYGSFQQSWFWSFDHLESDSVTPAVSTIEEPTHLFPTHGFYGVTYIVETNFGCRDTFVTEFLVIEPPQPQFGNIPFCFGEVAFNNTTVPGDKPIETVNWNFGDGIGSSSTTDSLLSYVYPEITTYPVTLTVTDTAGCVGEITTDITVKDTPLFDEMPNILTPNGDGVNDDFSFLPVYDDCYDYRFTLFNRWGGKVFETESSQNGFSGISNLGSKLKDGVYFWVLLGNGLGNGSDLEVKMKGTLTVAGTK